MDIRLYYEEQGSGKPLLLLHGNGEDGSYFRHQMAYFAKSRRVIALDTRGHGKSPRGSAPFTIRQFAEDLRAFMDQHAMESADILGFSDGGNIALTLAVNDPGRVDRLILNGANLNPGGVKPSVQIPIVLGYRFASLFAGKSPEAAKHAQLLGLMVKEPDLRPEDLKKIRARTLVIAGTRDMIKESHTRLICGSIPHAKLALIPGDHFVAAKNPEAFNRAVADFLEDSE